LTFFEKYAIIHPIKTKENKYQMHHYLEQKRIVERQKQRCREKIDFHKKNVILQSMVSLMCVAGGIYAAQKKSIAVPLVLAPMAGASISKLASHETKRQRYKEILNELERN
jgi:Na+/H+ antiporter NhaD/arsenite permease-like protein